jgi:hypothetical protein
MNDPPNFDRHEILKMVESISPATSPEAFTQVYQSVLATSPDRYILSRLMWTAGMYLDRHPGVQILPREIAEGFLASDDIDELLAGLKAIRHSTASTDEIITHFLAVMQRESWEEREAGLYQLGQVLTENALGVVAAVDQAVLDDLRAVLAQMTLHHPRDHERDLASRCMSQIMDEVREQ